MTSRVQQIGADYDDEGIFVYQAFSEPTAVWAVEKQTFMGCPQFNPDRKTWIKPSFGWVLYRSGYGLKHHQDRILKIKLDHDTLGVLLSNCVCGHGQGGTDGRIQWDPERDMMTSKNGQEPRKMRCTRAIQIGLAGHLSRKYVEGILTIEDVTDLSHAVGRAHKILAKDPKSNVMEELVPLLPIEEMYLPKVSKKVLVNIALAPGEKADEVAGLGYSNAKPLKNIKKYIRI
jgi:hypothetical protein